MITPPSAVSGSKSSMALSELDQVMAFGSMLLTTAGTLKVWTPSKAEYITGEKKIFRSFCGHRALVRSLFTGGLPLPSDDSFEQAAATTSAKARTLGRR